MNTDKTIDMTKTIWCVDYRRSNYPRTSPFNIFGLYEEVPVSIPVSPTVPSISSISSSFLPSLTITQMPSRGSNRWFDCQIKWCFIVVLLRHVTTFSHLLSPPLTSSYLLSPPLTSSHLLSPPLTSSYLLSPPVTSSLLSPASFLSHSLPLIYVDLFRFTLRE